MRDFAEREAEAAGLGLPSEDRRAYAGSSLRLGQLVEDLSREDKSDRVHPRIAAAVLALAETDQSDTVALALRRSELAVAVESAARKNDNPRNLPCPCGSGRKFKKCCGNAGSAHSYLLIGMRDFEAAIRALEKLL